MQAGIPLRWGVFFVVVVVFKTVLTRAQLDVDFHLLYQKGETLCCDQRKLDGVYTYFKVLKVYQSYISTSGFFNKHN